jgi:hypothetical protein
MPHFMERFINDILVVPRVLQTTAGELVQGAKRIRSALTAVDHIIMQLDISEFEGRRALMLLSRYRKMRGMVTNWPKIIELFSRDLYSTAAIFEQADRPDH